MKAPTIAIKPLSQNGYKAVMRERVPKGVNPNLGHLSEFWKADEEETFYSRKQKCSEDIKAKTGRKMQNKCVPLREIAVTIDESVTMEEIKELGEQLKDIFGIEIFQIAIHRDDVKNGVRAHLIADWVNHGTGRTIKLNRGDLKGIRAILQPIVARKSPPNTPKTLFKRISSLLRGNTPPNPQNALKSL